MYFGIILISKYTYGQVMENKTAYIEQNGMLLPDEKKLVIELNKRKIPIVYFSKKQLSRNKIKIEHPYLVSAGLTSMKHIFSQYNIPMPLSNSYPKELLDLYKREVMETTLGKSLIRYKKGEDFFIKPKDDFKSFTGFVASYDPHFLDKLTRKFKPDYLVYNCGIIDIKSEHRAYVAHGIVLETSNYFGDDSVLDMKAVERAINTLSLLNSTPSAYAIDFAITTDEETIVLELNEGFSIDSYDCSSENYFTVIKTRWDELYNLSNL